MEQIRIAVERGYDVLAIDSGKHVEDYFVERREELQALSKQYGAYVAFANASIEQLADEFSDEYTAFFDSVEYQFVHQTLGDKMRSCR